MQKQVRKVCTLENLDNALSDFPVRLMATGRVAKVEETAPAFGMTVSQSPYPGAPPLSYLPLGRHPYPGS